MTQITFDFKDKKISVRLMVLEAMSDGSWWRLEWLVAYCKNRYDTWVSDATVSARLRELSKQGYPHESRPREGNTHAVEYRLLK